MLKNSRGDMVYSRLGPLNPLLHFTGGPERNLSANIQNEVTNLLQKISRRTGKVHRLGTALIDYFHLLT